MIPIGRSETAPRTKAACLRAGPTRTRQLRILEQQSDKQTTVAVSTLHWRPNHTTLTRLYTTDCDGAPSSWYKRRPSLWDDRARALLQSHRGPSAKIGTVPVRHRRGERNVRRRSKSTICVSTGRTRRTSLLSSGLAASVTKASPEAAGVARKATVDCER